MKGEKPNKYRQKNEQKNANTVQDLCFEVFKQVNVYFIHSVFAERMTFICSCAWYVVW